MDIVMVRVDIVMVRMRKKVKVNRINDLII